MKQPPRYSLRFTCRIDYEIGAYPTFLFLNAEGEELGRVTGTRLNEDYVVVIRSRGREDPGGERLRRLLEQQKDGQ